MPTQFSLSEFEWLLSSDLRADGRAQRALSVLRVPTEEGNADAWVVLNVRRMLKALYPQMVFRVQALNLPGSQSQVRVLFADFPDTPARQDVEKALRLWLKVTHPLTAATQEREVHQGLSQFQALMGAAYSIEVCSHPAQPLDVERRRIHLAKKAGAHLKVSLPDITLVKPAKLRM